MKRKNSWFVLIFALFLQLFACNDSTVAAAWFINIPDDEGRNAGDVINASDINFPLIN